MRLTECNGCRAQIGFLRTKNGKWIPVNPDEIEPDDAEEGDLLVGDNGSTLRIGDGKPELGVSYYLSHFAECPEAERFRK